MQAALLSDPQHCTAARNAAAANATAAPGSGSQEPTVGRKVTGGMAEWVDRKERMINMLEFRKPIEYTVKLACKDPIAGVGPKNVLPSVRLQDHDCDWQVSR